MAKAISFATLLPGLANLINWNILKLLILVVLWDYANTVDNIEIALEKRSNSEKRLYLGIIYDDIMNRELTKNLSNLTNIILSVQLKIKIIERDWNM